MLVASMSLIVLVVYSSGVSAFPTYDGCKDCHGSFTRDNYVSEQDGARWNQSLMDGHENFVSDACDACHKSGSKGEVYLNSSRDGTLSKSCVGCHGRQEDVNGNCTGLGGGVEVECGGAAGLRQHHESNVGAGTCASCHSGDPTPVGEHVTPYFFGLGRIVMKSSCDSDGTESQFGSSGLDNDGDGPRDGSDSDCLVNSLPSQPATLSAAAVTSRSATVSWGASTDGDGDPITYQVDYRQNGAVPWTSGGSTSSTSRVLNDLVSAQSYDVRITPNDGKDNGPALTALDLFQTQSLDPLACLELGALAYDNWTKSDAGGTDLLPDGAVRSDYVRCKSCHGWDHMGTDGGYSRRSREESRPNSGKGDSDKSSRNISLAGRAGANVTADMIWHQGTGRSFADGAASWVALDDTASAANTAAHAGGYTMGNQHPDFSTGGPNSLTGEQVDCLVMFLNSEDADASVYFAAIYPDPSPVQFTIIETADAAAGESYYNLNCASCHGNPEEDNQPGSGGVPAGGILAYLAQDGKFSEFSHKARWGIPGSSMTRAAIGSPTSMDVADMMLWLLPASGNGFAINPGLSGNWWGGLTRDGEGFLVDVATNLFEQTILLVSFYTYDTRGNQIWLIGAGPVNGDTGEITLTIPEGAMWGSAFDPADLASPRPEWGTGTFRFTSCGAGSVVLMPNATMRADGFTNLSYEINREILIPGVACPTPAK